MVLVMKGFFSGLFFRELIKNARTEFIPIVLNNINEVSIIGFTQKQCLSPLVEI
jgi:hypothetical protein